MYERIKSRLEKGTLQSGEFNWVRTEETAHNIGLFAKHSGMCFAAWLMVEMIVLFIDFIDLTIELVRRYPIHTIIAAAVAIACLISPEFANGAGLIGSALVIGVIGGCCLIGFGYFGKEAAKFIWGMVARVRGTKSS